jgi:transcription elongation factor GreA
VLPNPLLGKENKNFVFYFAFHSLIRILAAPKVLPLGKENKNFVFYFAFHSLIRILAAPKVLPLGKENKNFVFYFAFHSLIRTFAGIMEYMSQEGYDKLVAELHQLEYVEYPKVKEALVEAREKGDLSENFEYHAAKREQAKLISRIRFKQKVLEFARVIDTNRLNSDMVGLLTTVKLTNLVKNVTMSYTIVSPHESNLLEKKLSIKSPIAQALLGKKVGDIVEVTVPAGVQRFRIENIEL